MESCSGKTNYPTIEEMKDTVKKNKYPCDVGCKRFFSKKQVMQEIAMYDDTAYKPGEWVVVDKDFSMKISPVVSFYFKKGMMAELGEFFPIARSWDVFLAESNGLRINVFLNESLLRKNR